ncbi:MAG: LysR family transcriptional regulator, partial [Pseudomonadota bacterium]
MTADRSQDRSTDRLPDRLPGPPRLPPLRALLALRALAGHPRMADAAASLGVTESAVSHQIRALETQLHVKLFDRSTGRLRLTPEGERYLARVAPALAELEAATAALMPAEGRRQVRLTLPPSLAATWLIPRLSRFEAANPAIDLDLVLTTRLVELARDQVDLAIR